MRFSSVFATACFAILFVSCQPDNPPAANSVQIKKTVITNSDKSVYTNDYLYNSQKKIIRIEHSSSLYDWKSIIDLEYDADLLKKATYRTINDSNIVTQNIQYYTFLYDDKKRIIKRLGTALQPGHEVNDNSYAYDINGRLIADTSIDKKTGKQENRKDIKSFTGVQIMILLRMNIMALINPVILI